MTIPSTPDRIVWRLSLRSPPQQVYRMLSTADGRARFWAESAEETDGQVHFRFINGAETRGRIIERRPPDRIVFEYFGSTVTFELRDNDRGGTDLTMTNTGFAPEDYLEILPGWLNVLLPLKAAVDFNVDLRSHDPSRTWERGYVDQ